MVATMYKKYRIRAIEYRVAPLLLRPPMIQSTKRPSTATNAKACVKLLCSCKTILVPKTTGLQSARVDMTSLQGHEPTVIEVSADVAA